MRQWVFSVPFPIRFLFASRPSIMGKVLGIVYRTLATHLIRKAGYTTTKAHTGAVTLIQRFGSALNLNKEGSLKKRLSMTSSLGWSPVKEDISVVRLCAPNPDQNR